MLTWLKEKKQRWLRPRTEETWVKNSLFAYARIFFCQCASYHIIIWYFGGGDHLPSDLNNKWHNFPIFSARRKPQCSEYQDDSEEESSSEHHICLRIVAPRLGVVLKLQVSYFDTGLQVKEKALKKLESMHSPSRSSTSFNSDINSYRLVRSSTKVAFKDIHSILNNHVQNGEEFLLITKRPDGNLRHVMSVQHSHGPTEKEILSRTRHLPLIRSSLSAGLNLSMDSAFFQSDLQHDLRKILSEIAKYSAYILGTLPFAEKLIKYYKQKILMSLNNHHDIVRLLIDMGFSRKNVLRALKLQGNNYSMALDWLVENVEKEEVVAEEEEGQSTTNNSLELSSESIEDVVADYTNKKFYSRTFPSTNSIFFSKHKAIVSSLTFINLCCLGGGVKGSKFYYTLQIIYRIE